MRTAQGTLSSASRVDLVRSGDEYFDLLIDLIRQAKQEIHLQVYIFDPDAIGKTILHELQNAVKRKVEVYLVVDAYGSQQLVKQYKSIETSGVKFKAFGPLAYKTSMQIGRRLHQKIVVIDAYKTLVGGINISDKYKGSSEKQAWLDYALYLEGTVAQQIRHICIRNWQRRNITRHLKKIKFGIVPVDASQAEKIRVRIRDNDWLRGKHQISGSYRQAIKHSKKEIIIMASYFLPGFRIRKLLSTAVNRGVDVKLILPFESDSVLVKRAITYLYDWLLRKGIKLYEWQPSIVHGKVAVVDDVWATVGSYNINHLSDYASLELNVDVLDEGTVASIKNEMKRLLADGCRPFTIEEAKKRSLLERFLNWFSFFFVRLTIKILFLFSKRHENKSTRQR